MQLSRSCLTSSCLVAGIGAVMKNAGLKFSVYAGEIASAAVKKMAGVLCCMVYRALHLVHK